MTQSRGERLNIVLEDGRGKQIHNRQGTEREMEETRGWRGREVQNEEDYVQKRRKGWREGKRGRREEGKEGWRLKGKLRYQSASSYLH